LRNSATAALAAFAIALAGSARVSAHRLDEYLQAARVAIDPTRVAVELDLTAGVSVAERVLGEIDRDRDGRISRDEAEAYGAQVLKSLALDVDGVPLAARVTATSFPAVEAIRTGVGTIRIEIVAVTSQTAAGAHHLHFRNAHRGDISVYLANALVPADDRVRIGDQQRDADQRTLDVSYALANPSDGLNAGAIRRYGDSRMAFLLIVFAAIVIGFLVWLTRRRGAHPYGLGRSRPLQSSHSPNVQVNS
jgi:hypothetical protein